MLIQKQFIQIELVGQLRKNNLDANATDAENNNDYTYVLTLLKKVKETKLKFSQGSVTVL